MRERTGVPCSDKAGLREIHAQAILGGRGQVYLHQAPDPMRHNVVSPSMCPSKPSAPSHKNRSCQHCAQ